MVGGGRDRRTEPASCDEAARMGHVVKSWFMSDWAHVRATAAMVAGEGL